MSWTKPSDVTDAWIGDDAPGNTTTVQTWIDKAEREIKRRVPDIQSRIEAEAAEVPPVTDLLDTAIDVVVAMVTRKFQNPKGYRQVQTTTGPFSESGTIGGDNPGQLYLTDDELAKLSDAGSRGAFMIDLIPPTSPFYAGG